MAYINGRDRPPPPCPGAILGARSRVRDTPDDACCDTPLGNTNFVVSPATSTVSLRDFMDQRARNEPARHAPVSLGDFLAQRAADQRVTEPPPGAPIAAAVRSEPRGVSLHDFMRRHEWTRPAHGKMAHASSGVARGPPPGGTVTDGSVGPFPDRARFKRERETVEARCDAAPLYADFDALPLQGPWPRRGARAPRPIINVSFVTKKAHQVVATKVAVTGAAVPAAAQPPPRATAPACDAAALRAAAIAVGDARYAPQAKVARVCAIICDQMQALDALYRERAHGAALDLFEGFGRLRLSPASAAAVA
jgi:hypothetical protein